MHEENEKVHAKKIAVAKREEDGEYETSVPVSHKKSSRYLSVQLIMSLHTI
jgi:hypothetical protein